MAPEASRSENKTNLSPIDTVKSELAPSPVTSHTLSPVSNPNIDTGCISPLASIAAHTLPLRLRSTYNLSDQCPTPSSQPTNARNANLQAKIQRLKSQIQETEDKLSSTLNQLQRFLPASPHPIVSSDTDGDGLPQRDLESETLAQAQALVNKHMGLLRRYNEIKDIGMGLMNLIADKDGKRLRDVMADFGVDGDD